MSKDGPNFMRRFIPRFLYRKMHLDRTRTYSYSDSQVVNIFWYGLFLGMVMGGIVTAALVQASR